jgi:hypothetical protein
VGDFNKVVNATEKYGRATRTDGQMEKFRDTIEIF